MVKWLIKRKYVFVTFVIVKEIIHVKHWTKHFQCIIHSALEHRLYERYKKLVECGKESSTPKCSAVNENKCRTIMICLFIKWMIFVCRMGVCLCVRWKCGFSFSSIVYNLQWKHCVSWAMRAHNCFILSAETLHKCWSVQNNELSVTMISPEHKCDTNFCTLSNGKPNDNFHSASPNMRLWEPKRDRVSARTRQLKNKIDGKRPETRSHSFSLFLWVFCSSSNQFSIHD